MDISYETPDFSILSQLGDKIIINDKEKTIQEHSHKQESTVQPTVQPTVEPTVQPTVQPKKKWTHDELERLEYEWELLSEGFQDDPISDNEELFSDFAKRRDTNPIDVYDELTRLGIEKMYNTFDTKWFKQKVKSDSTLDDKDTNFLFDRANKILKNLQDSDVKITPSNYTIISEPYRCLERVIDKDPKYFKAYLAMAVGHYNSKRYWEGYGVLISGINENRYYPDFWLLRAEISEKLKNFQDVKFCYAFLYGLDISKKDKDLLKQHYDHAVEKLNQSK